MLVKPCYLIEFNVEHLIGPFKYFIRTKMCGYTMCLLVDPNQNYSNSLTKILYMTFKTHFFVVMKIVRTRHLVNISY